MLATTADVPGPRWSARAFMDLPLPPRGAVLALAVLVAAVLSASWLLGFYPSYFHSDSAAHQVLAQAMLDEGRLLPRDFAYNNQLILWRNQFFIAVALKAGLEGYRAYVVGSVLTFIPFFVIAFLAIDALLGDWARSLLVTFAWFVPLGMSEGDYLFGQQTHLAACVFALVLAVHAWKAAEGAKRSVAICAIVAFALVVEAPARAVMLMLPFAVMLWLAGRAGPARRLAIAVLVAAVSAYAANRWLASGLTIRGVAAVPLSSYSHFAARAHELMAFFVDLYIGFFEFQNATAVPLHLALYASKTALLAAFVAVFWMFAARLFRRCRAAAAPPIGPVEFIGEAAVVHLVIGWWLVSAIEYGIDVRHILWAPMLLKLVLIVLAIEWVARKVSRPAGQAAIVAATAVLLASAVQALVLPVSTTVSKQERALARSAGEYPQVAQRMAQLGTQRLYGTYWEVMRADVLMPGAQAAPLFFAGGRVHFDAILTRPSRRCAHGDVLYVLDGESADEAAIAQQVVARGGRVLDTFSGRRALYAGPPVWDQAGCP